MSNDRDLYSVIPQGSRVLVTGASGFTGQVLVRKLVDSGADVTCIARATSKTSAFEGLPVKWVRGDVYDPPTVAQAMAGIEFIFHVAAAYREPSITDEIYEKVHVESTKLLAHAALAQSNFKRFLHVSTVGVHGHIDDPPANEEYRFSPGDVYQRTKADAEVWIRDYARHTGLPIAIVRPAAIYGPGDRRLLKIFKLASKPVFPVFGMGQGLYHLIHVNDLTDIFIRAAVHPKALGEVFIGGNDAPSKIKDIVNIICAALEKKPPAFIKFPVWPLFLAADVCEAFCKPFGISPPLYRRRAAFFTKDRAFDTRKLREVLGYTQSIDVKSGLSETARWYRDQGWL